MEPHKNTYKLIFENYAPTRPIIRIAFQFKPEGDPYLHPNCRLINAKDLLTNKLLPAKELQALQKDPQFTLRWAEAIDLLKWSIKHDPEPQEPTTAAFIETI